MSPCVTTRGRSCYLTSCRLVSRHVTSRHGVSCQVTVRHLFSRHVVRHVSHVMSCRLPRRPNVKRGNMTSASSTTHVCARNLSRETTSAHLRFPRETRRARTKRCACQAKHHLRAPNGTVAARKNPATREGQNVWRLAGSYAYYHKHYQSAPSAGNEAAACGISNYAAPPPGYYHLSATSARLPRETPSAGTKRCACDRNRRLRAPDAPAKHSSDPPGPKRAACDCELLLSVCVCECERGQTTTRTTTTISCEAE